MANAESRQLSARRGFADGDHLFDLVSKAAKSVGELDVDLDIQVHDGPVNSPERKQTPWPLQKAARKKHDKRRGRP